MPTPASPTVRLRRLGAELRRHREAAGLTAEEAAVALDCHGSKISRMENGRSAVRPRDVRDLLKRYGVDDPALSETLEALAREGKRRGWWQNYSESVSPEHSEYIGLEAVASSIRSYQNMILPGLLQTADYTRAIIDSHVARLDEDAIDSRLTVRHTRQKVLDRTSPPFHMWAVVHEAALRAPVGGAQVMRGQIDALVTRVAEEKVTLQVLPFAAGAHAGMHGPFVILGYPEMTELDVVLLENLTSSLYLEEPSQVARYTEIFDHLRATALSPRDSLAFLKTTYKDL